MTDITLDQLRAIFPTTKKETLALYVDPLNETFEKFDITTVARKSMFLAQVGHESAGFTAVRENLNYSKDGLRKVFGKYFPTDALAAQYARQPEKIANRVYANRGGNGNEASGDGWKYRGRGAIQCTFKSTYESFGKAMGMDLDKVPAYLETPLGAVMSAGWFWDTRDLNALADQTRFTDMTKRINGGHHGLQARKDLWARARSVLA